MAKLILRDALKGMNVDLDEVDLEATTTDMVINEAVRNGILDPVAGNSYKVIGKDNMPVVEDATLASLGFKDGDTITVVAKPCGAIA